jgi:hypothetical protein
MILVIRGYQNDPKKLEISEIDLNTDFDLNLIEDYFNKIEK